MGLRDTKSLIRALLSAALAFIAFCGFWMAMMLLWGALTGCTPAYADMKEAPTHDSLGVTWTHDGEAIRWYVFTDPDSGIQYLVNDRGGCVERGMR